MSAPVTCDVCWAAFKSRREIHSQHDRWICCRCMGHSHETCRSIEFIDDFDGNEVAIVTNRAVKIEEVN